MKGEAVPSKSRPRHGAGIQGAAVETRLRMAMGPLEPAGAKSGGWGAKRYGSQVGRRW